MVWLPSNTALRAGVFMVLAMASFVTNDTFVKLIGNSLPVGEIVFIRGIMTTAFIAALCAWQGVLAAAPQIASRQVVLRASLDMVSTLLFITALMNMHIANLTAIMQAVPLAVVMLSVFFLGERVGIRRSAAIGLGLVAVMMIVKPVPSEFTADEGYALVIVFLLACRDIITRRIPAKIPTLVIALANALFVTLGGLALGLRQGFIALEAWQLGYLALASLFLGMGYMFMVTTIRTGELSASAPFRYSILVFAIVSGIVVFGEIPDALAVSGMVLIAATGLYAAHRETLLNSTSRKQLP